MLEAVGSTVLGLTANRNGIYFGDGANILTSSVDGCTTWYTKVHWSIHFKIVNFILCEIYQDTI